MVARHTASGLLLITLAAFPAGAGGWPQWGGGAGHRNASPVYGQRLSRILGDVVYDPFVEAEMEDSGRGVLLVHYQAPIVDGRDVFMTFKTGTFVSRPQWDTQVWNVKRLTWSGGQFREVWSNWSDWKPVPYGGATNWEPVFHPAIDGEVVWAPAAGGTLLRFRRSDGFVLSRVNPFGVAIEPSIFVTSPLTIDAGGNVFYNAICFDLEAPWTNDVVNSWLVRVTPDGRSTIVPYSVITPGAPSATGQCLDAFPANQLPWPPSPTAVPPSIVCGSQRPGVNVAPAVADDGTIYTVSRTHFNARWGYLVAVNPDLTPKWTASLRDRFNDGCNVTIPPNGTPGGCRAGARTGVDPSDNTAGAGRVFDTSTSSPTVAPDGSILYGANTRYNYSAGHLMKFSADGDYLGAYPYGWDFTPTIWEHDGTWSIIIKENHYFTGSYCSDATVCPVNRSVVTPNDPEQYFITQLGPDLEVEWRFRNTSTESCARQPDGSLKCESDHPYGFEWCVNAVAVDAAGVVYANNEDGRLYAIGQGGVLIDSIFLQLALGAAYTPLSIGPEGLIYTQNAGHLFVVGSTRPGKRRAVLR